MSNKMRESLKHTDKEKIAKMYAIKQEFEAGNITLEQMSERLKEEVGDIRPEEFALMEQTYTPTDEDPNACRFEKLSYVNRSFGQDWSDECPSLPDGHPVKTYYNENLAIGRAAKEAEKLLEKKFIKNPWLEVMDKLAQVRIHYSRKQNQLYPALERHGFMHPSKTMWTYDDFNRDNISAARRLLDADQIEEFLSAVREMLPSILDLMDKEVRILLPTSLSLISEEEFRGMRSGDDEIGYCLIDKPIGFRPEGEEEEVQASSEPQQEGFAADLQNLLSKYGYSAPSSDKVLDVAMGKLTLEQINLLYKHMPVDFSFVDENDIVKFYTDTKHRVFPRSSGVIGREVRNCHPPKSVHVVQEIIEKFRSGEKDEAEFWINKPDLFIYILYVAVRDEQGRFRGVLEMMQDCTRIRKLTGSQLLLNWEAGTMVEGDNVRNTAENLKADAEEKAKAEPQESAQASCESKKTETKTACGCSCDSAKGDFNKDTKLTELIEIYPDLRDRLVEIDERFKMVQNPVMFNTIGRLAKLSDMAERTDQTVEELIQKIKNLYK